MVEAMDAGLDLEAADRPPISTAEFEAMAARSYARMPSTQLYARGLHPTLNRARRLPRRASQSLVPSPTAVVSPARGAGERAHRFRDQVRHGRSLVHWAIRPRDLPNRLLRTHRRALLEELSELTTLQRHGARALATGASSPFVVIIAKEAAELRIALVTNAAARQQLPDLPEDLGWVSRVVLDLSDPWLIPNGVADAAGRTFSALSAVFRDRPDVGRRLLAGRTPWCAVVVLTEPPSGSPQAPPAGADGV